MPSRPSRPDHVASSARLLRRHLGVFLVGSLLLATLPVYTRTEELKLRSREKSLTERLAETAGPEESRREAARRMAAEIELINERVAEIHTRNTVGMTLGLLILVAFSAAPALRRAEDSLREQEEAEAERAAMLVSAADFVVLLDAEGKIDGANDALADRLGVPPDDLRGASFADFLADGQTFRDSLEGMIDDRPLMAAFRTPVGEIPVELKASSLVRGRILAVGRDLSRARDLEEALETERRRNENILHHFPDILLQMDADGRVLWVHAPDPKSLVCPPEEMIGKRLVDLVVPERRPLVAAAFDNVVRSGEIQTYEYATPSRREWEGRMAPLSDGGAILMVREVTAARRTQRELLAKEARLEEAEQVGGFGSWQSDLDGKIRWSRGARVLLGIPNGMPDPDRALYNTRIHPDDLERVETARQPVYSGGSYEVEYRMRTWDERDIVILGRGRAETSEDGTTVTVHGTLRDVTREREQAEDLRRASTLATEASRLKGEFLANTSHEIRTPMHHILGMVHLMESTRLDSRQKRYASTIRTSAEGLLGIINDILDLSKVEAGRLEVDARDVDLVAEVRERMGPFRAEADRKGVALVVDLPSESLPVRTDPMRFGQIATNLVSNALKFTAQGTVTLKMRAEAPVDDRTRVCLEVTDTGIGIPPERLTKIFDPFVQADGGTTRHFGGSGLGLAIVRRLAHLLGGEIEVESVVGEGSTFRLNLVMPIGHVPRPVSAPALPLPPRDLRGVRVLLAEDNRINQAVVSEVLDAAGAEVRIAEDGEQAVRFHAEHGPFDVILMDVQMPLLDGYAAAARVRAAGGPRVPIVAMTANAGEDDRRRAFESGMDDFAPKPLPPRDLLDVVARWATPDNPVPMVPDSAADPHSDSSVAYDRAVLDDAFGPDSPVKNEVLAMFLDQTPAQLDLYADAVASGDADAAYGAVHKLKGSSGAVGAMRLFARCQGAMEKAKAGHPEPPDALRATYAEAAREIEADLGAVRA